MFDYSGDHGRFSNVAQRTHEQAVRNYKLAQAIKLSKPRRKITLTTVTYGLLFVTCGAFVATVIQGLNVFYWS